eukprot:CAMPEP_0168497222 /NCGR_PEP_ID=MMETSP0228-20121227/72656_1 /TAXON_ID=133427 /ORGANISM="Protoceratium reticulatum, Strain CCCM 535 (=CCMP 1889)" /LENGTH=76 /DNA_ID=CAMNT_0008514095 /DNA_START=1 /DNA_END=227 /DNA_ORIENTATION=-
MMTSGFMVCLSGTILMSMSFALMFCKQSILSTFGMGCAIAVAAVLWMSCSAVPALLAALPRTFGAAGSRWQDEGRG